MCDVLDNDIGLQVMWFYVLQPKSYRLAFANP